MAAQDKQSSCGCKVCSRIWLRCDDGKPRRDLFNLLAVFVLSELATIPRRAFAVTLRASASRSPFLVVLSKNGMHRRSSWAW